MVSGIYRIGGVAALIADADRYVLATYFQENLKYVRPGQPVEVSLDLYPGPSAPTRGSIGSIQSTSDKTSSHNDSCAKRGNRSAALALRRAPTELA
jgi:multidrug resistance efflux pump